jgi:hypothetical protein
MDFQALVRSVPPVTRIQLAATVLVTLYVTGQFQAAEQKAYDLISPVLLQLLHPAYVSSSWYRAVTHYEVGPGLQLDLTYAI